MFHFDEQEEEMLEEDIPDLQQQNHEVVINIFFTVFYFVSIHDTS